MNAEMLLAEKNFSRNEKAMVVIGVLLVVAPWLWPFEQWLDLTTIHLDWLNLLSFIVLTLAIPLIPIFLIAACVDIILHPNSRSGYILIIAALAGCVSFLGAREVAFSTRHNVFFALAVRSRPLVESLKKYEREIGKPAPDLKALVPEYIEKIPGTGIPKYPEYGYSPESYTPPNKWELYVPCGWGILNWDMFLYLPEQNYPENGYGGSLEPVGDWAYVHE